MPHLSVMKYGRGDDLLLNVATINDYINIIDLCIVSHVAHNEYFTVTKNKQHH